MSHVKVKRLTVTEAYELALTAGFTVSHATIYNLIKSSGKATQLGGRWFISEDDFLHLLHGGTDAKKNTNRE